MARRLPPEWVGGSAEGCALRFGWLKSVQLSWWMAGLGARSHAGKACWRRRWLAGRGYVPCRRD